MPKGFIKMEKLNESKDWEGLRIHTKVSSKHIASPTPIRGRTLYSKHIQCRRKAKNLKIDPIFRLYKHNL